MGDIEKCPGEIRSQLLTEVVGKLSGLKALVAVSLHTGRIRMEEKEIQEVLDTFNQYLSGQSWMDFELIEFSGGELKIIGSLDISSRPDIELVFKDVFFASAPFNWTTDTSRQVAVLLSGEEAKKVNLEYQVELGYHIIKIYPEDYPEDFGCLFGVKSAFFRVL